MNIVELVTSHLTKDVVGNVGSLIGESPETTKTAISAAVPALLAGFTQFATQPGGAAALDAAVSKQDTGILGNLAGAFGSQGASLAQQGGNLLSSLFDNNLFSGLLRSLSNFTGLGQNSARGLMGALVPVVLGTLGKLKSSLGLDAGGLASTLLGQKQNIVSAMPAGLSGALGSVSGLGSFLSGAGSAVSSAASAAYGAAKSGGREVAAAARSGASSAMRWVLPLILVLAVIWILSKVLSRPATPTSSSTIENVGQTLTGEASSLATQLTGVVSSAKDALAGITDSVSANAALPKLRDLNSKLDSLKPVWDGLPSSAKAGVSSVLKSLMASLTPLVDKARALPGVGDILKPVLDEMNTKLSSFSA
jgi:hypothetical protein